MSTLPFAPRIGRNRVLLYCLMTLVTAGLIVLATRPRYGRAAPLSAPVVYVSYASLLLSPGARFQMNSVFVSTGQSDLDFWLSDPELFDKLLERQRIYEKVAARLAPRHPELAALSRLVSVRPVTMSASKDPKGLQDPRTQGASQYGLSGLFENQRAEKDYASLDSSEAEDEDYRSRINRIVLRAAAATPKDSEMLALTFASVLQNELEEVATRRARARRKSIENFIRAGSKKLARAEKALLLGKASEPEKVALKRAQIRTLEDRCLALLRETSDLTRQIEAQLDDSAFRAALQANPAQDALASLETEVRQAEQTFLPSSSTLVRLKERLRGLRQLGARMDAERAESMVTLLRFRLSEANKRLEQSQRELAALRQGLPSPGAVRDFQELEREAATWEAELLSWQQQLLGARIEERLCKGDGTAVLLQSPLPGTRQFVAAQTFFRAYRRTLTLLPLAPLVGLVGLLLLHLLQEARGIRTRAEYFFDAPVLAELPSVDRNYRKTWQQLKTRGRSGRSENLSP